MRLRQLIAMVMLESWSQRRFSGGPPSSLHFHKQREGKTHYALRHNIQARML
jgi:hypothetical protein